MSIDPFKDNEHCLDMMEHWANGGDVPKDLPSSYDIELDLDEDVPLERGTTYGREHKEPDAPLSSYDHRVIDAPQKKVKSKNDNRNK